ncbi:MAG: formylglycine-generating enzyme family protein [Kiritimatiellia bacterium]
MKTRSLPLLIFPILGMVLAVLFRSPELDWKTLQPFIPAYPEKKTLSLPDGQALRFIRIPGESSWLSVTEVPRSILQRYPGETASHHGARAFAVWLSEQTGQSLRLPNADEWRQAARAGFANAEFVWGYGPPLPPPGLNFALEHPPRRPGPAFGWGFRDMAGGLWEWTQEGLLLGSAWSEQNPETLYIDHPWQPPPGYAGADTGIRLLWEISTVPDPH